MDLIKWANGNGETMQLDLQEAELLKTALETAIRTGKGNVVLENKEIDVEIV